MITPTKEFLEVFKKTEGALSVAESIAIMNIAAQAPEGIYIEFGTFKGKSAMSALVALKEGVFYLVDPIFSDYDKEGSVIDYIYCNIDKLPETFKVGVLFEPEISLNVLNKEIPYKYSYVFVDSGSHGDGLPMEEVVLLEDKIEQGGVIAFHDFRSQFVEVELAYNYLLSTGKYEEIPINWNEIIAYVNDNNLEEGNVSWHHTEMKNPNFVGALKRI